MCRKPRQQRGVFIIETTAALAITGVVLFAVSALVISYERADETFVTQRRLQLAAEGQMERYRAGQALPTGGIDLNGPGGIRLRVECSAGQGDWRGLVRVEVTATTDLRHRRRLSHRVSGYVAPVAEHAVAPATDQAREEP